ncbi:MAG: hypothetical protein PVG39_02310 [Desulfobacteraceae bacterium]|jgi:hypothetical protein
MFVLSPNDNRVNDDSAAAKDRNFGGNRKVTTNIQKSEDYTKPGQGRRANLSGDAEKNMTMPEATMDIDDMNDPQARKREMSRRAETSTTGADNQYRRAGDGDKIYSDSNNRPAPDTRGDSHIEPDPNKKHGSRLPNMIGEYHDKPADQNTAADQKPR